MVKLSNNPIAVEASELVEFGCVHCGYSEGQLGTGGGGWMIWTCKKCKKYCIALQKGFDKVPVRFRGSGDKDGLYPRLQQHPRKGISRHGPESEWKGLTGFHLLVSSKK